MTISHGHHAKIKVSCVHLLTHMGKSVFLHRLTTMSLLGEECSSNHNKDFSPSLLPCGGECFIFLIVCVCVCVHMSGAMTGWGEGKERSTVQ